MNIRQPSDNIFHGDPIISGTADGDAKWEKIFLETQDKLSKLADQALASMAESESQDKRPKCDWRITKKMASGGTTSEPCGSEEKVYEVAGQGKYTGRPRKTNICERHLTDAVKEWNWDTAVPVDTMPDKS